MFKIDLNNPDEVTLENVQKLIASKDDTDFHQIRVTFGGVAFVSDDYGNTNAENFALCYETFDRGTSNLGVEASQNEEWVSRVFNRLSTDWAKGARGYKEFTLDSPRKVSQ